MVKSHEKKNFKIFFPDGVVKFCRNLNFEKMDTALTQEKIMGFDYSEEYLTKQN